MSPTNLQHITKTFLIDETVSFGCVWGIMIIWKMENMSSNLLSIQKRHTERCIYQNVFIIMLPYKRKILIYL